MIAYLAQDAAAGHKLFKAQFGGKRDNAIEKWGRVFTSPEQLIAYELSGVVVLEPVPAKLIATAYARLRRLPDGHPIVIPEPA